MDGSEDDSSGVDYSDDLEVMENVIQLPSFSPSQSDDRLSGDVHSTGSDFQALLVFRGRAINLLSSRVRRFREKELISISLSTWRAYTAKKVSSTRIVGMARALHARTLLRKVLHAWRGGFHVETRRDAAWEGLLSRAEEVTLMSTVFLQWRLVLLARQLQDERELNTENTSAIHTIRSNAEASLANANKEIERLSSAVDRSEGLLERLTRKLVGVTLAQQESHLRFHAFRRWSRFAIRRRQVIEKVQLLLTWRANSTLRRCFVSWRRYLNLRISARNEVNAIIDKKDQAATWVFFSAWRRKAAFGHAIRLHMYHREQRFAKNALRTWRERVAARRKAYRAFILIRDRRRRIRYVKAFSVLRSHWINGLSRRLLAEQRRNSIMYKRTLVFRYALRWRGRCLRKIQAEVTTLQTRILNSLDASSTHNNSVTSVFPPSTHSAAADVAMAQAKAAVDEVEAVLRLTVAERAALMREREKFSKEKKKQRSNRKNDEPLVLLHTSRTFEGSQRNDATDHVARQQLGIESGEILEYADEEEYKEEILKLHDLVNNYEEAALELQRENSALYAEITSLRQHVSSLEAQSPNRSHQSLSSPSQESRASGDGPEAVDLVKRVRKLEAGLEMLRSQTESNIAPTSQSPEKLSASDRLRGKDYVRRIETESPLPDVGELLDSLASIGERSTGDIRSCTRTAASVSASELSKLEAQIAHTQCELDQLKKANKALVEEKALLLEKLEENASLQEKLEETTQRNQIVEAELSRQVEETVEARARLSEAEMLLQQAHHYVSLQESTSRDRDGEKTGSDSREAPDECSDVSPSLSRSVSRSRSEATPESEPESESKGELRGEVRHHAWQSDPESDSANPCARTRLHRRGRKGSRGGERTPGCIDARGDCIRRRAHGGGDVSRSGHGQILLDECVDDVERRSQVVPAQSELLSIGRHLPVPEHVRCSQSEQSGPGGRAGRESRRDDVNGCGFESEFRNDGASKGCKRQEKTGNATVAAAESAVEGLRHLHSKLCKAEMYAKSLEIERADLKRRLQSATTQAEEEFRTRTALQSTLSSQHDRLAEQLVETMREKDSLEREIQTVKATKEREVSGVSETADRNLNKMKEEYERSLTACQRELEVVREAKEIMEASLRKKSEEAGGLLESVRHEKLRREDSEKTVKELMKKIETLESEVSIQQTMRVRACAVARQAEDRESETRQQIDELNERLLEAIDRREEISRHRDAVLLAHENLIQESKNQLRQLDELRQRVRDLNAQVAVEQEMATSSQRAHDAEVATLHEDIKEFRRRVHVAWMELLDSGIHSEALQSAMHYLYDRDTLPTPGSANGDVDDVADVETTRPLDSGGELPPEELVERWRASLWKTIDNASDEIACLRQAVQSLETRNAALTTRNQQLVSLVKKPSVGVSSLPKRVLETHEDDGGGSTGGTEDSDSDAGGAKGLRGRLAWCSSCSALRQKCLRLESLASKRQAHVSQLRGEVERLKMLPATAPGASVESETRATCISPQRLRAQTQTQTQTQTRCEACAEIALRQAETRPRTTVQKTTPSKRLMGGRAAPTPRPGAQSLNKLRTNAASHAMQTRHTAPARPLLKPTASTTSHHTATHTAARSPPCTRAPETSKTPTPVGSRPSDHYSLSHLYTPAGPRHSPPRQPSPPRAGLPNSPEYKPVPSTTARSAMPHSPALNGSVHAASTTPRKSCPSASQRLYHATIGPQSESEAPCKPAVRQKVQGGESTAVTPTAASESPSDSESVTTPGLRKRVRILYRHALLSKGLYSLHAEVMKRHEALRTALGFRRYWQVAVVMAAWKSYTAFMHDISDSQHSHVSGRSSSSARRHAASTSTAIHCRIQTGGKRDVSGTGHERYQPEMHAPNQNAHTPKIDSLAAESLSVGLEDGKVLTSCAGSVVSDSDGSGDGDGGDRKVWSEKYKGRERVSETLSPTTLADWSGIRLLHPGPRADLEHETLDERKTHPLSTGRDAGVRQAWGARDAVNTTPSQTPPSCTPTQQNRLSVDGGHVAAGNRAGICSVPDVTSRHDRRLNVVHANPGIAASEGDSGPRSPTGVPIPTDRPQTAIGRCRPRQPPSVPTDGTPSYHNSYDGDQSSRQEHHPGLPMQHTVPQRTEVNGSVGTSGNGGVCAGTSAPGEPVGRAQEPTAALSMAEYDALSFSPCDGPATGGSEVFRKQEWPMSPASDPAPAADYLMKDRLIQYPAETRPHTANVVTCAAAAHVASQPCESRHPPPMSNTAAPTTLSPASQRFADGMVRWLGELDTSGESSLRSVASAIRLAPNHEAKNTPTLNADEKEGIDAELKRMSKETLREPGGGSRAPPLTTECLAGGVGLDAALSRSPRQPHAPTQQPVVKPPSRISDLPQPTAASQQQTSPRRRALGSDQPSSSSIVSSPVAASTCSPQTAASHTSTFASSPAVSLDSSQTRSSALRTPPRPQDAVVPSVAATVVTEPAATTSATASRTGMADACPRTIRLETEGDRGSASTRTRAPGARTAYVQVGGVSGKHNEMGNSASATWYSPEGRVLDETSLGDFESEQRIRQCRRKWRHSVLRRCFDWWLVTTLRKVAARNGCALAAASLCGLPIRNEALLMRELLQELRCNSSWSSQSATRPFSFIW
eukprot:Rmarinus@m.28377